MRAAIGCRDHSGWAVLVAMGGEPEAPSVLLRERVTLVADAVRMPYHLAADRSRGEAEVLIDRVEREAESGAFDALRSFVGRLQADEHEVAGIAVAAGATAVPSDLQTILGSHTLLHAAEGELYREAIASAAEAWRLPVTRFLNKRAIADAAAALGVAADALDGRLKALGKPLGPPWQKDHREAAAAALLVLVG
jgi:hypothetical protein